MQNSLFGFLKSQRCRSGVLEGRKQFPAAFRHVPVLNFLQSFGAASFQFPWAQETFADFLDPASPWLISPSTSALQLFAKVTGEELSARALAKLSRQLEAAFEASQGLAAYDWKNLEIRQLINGVDLAYYVGAELEFLPLIEKASDADLVIVHEPFTFQYSAPMFPEKGLEHICPASTVIEEASQYYCAAINPEGHPVCGLHIRRGDYATWLNGDYYYEDDFWLEAAAKLSDEGFRVSVFTNEPDSDLCSRLTDSGASLSGGSPGQDLARLMLMDRIMGPPSTFPLVATRLAGFCLGRSITYQMLSSRHEHRQQAEAG